MNEKNKPINIVFDGPPSHDSGRFVEVETDDGKGIKVGEWIQKGNYWALRITELPIDENSTAEESTTSAMPMKSMEANEKLRSIIDGILKTCGNSGTCRGSDCRKPIVWMKTKNGKNTCYDYDGSTHWATCKSSRMFKNGGKH